MISEQQIKNGDYNEQDVLALLEQVEHLSGVRGCRHIVLERWDDIYQCNTCGDKMRLSDG